MKIRFLLSGLLTIVFTLSSNTTTLAAEPRGVNYDESKMPPFTLPDPLVFANGKKVSSVKAWQNSRRPELLELFRSQMYGRAPGRPSHMKFEVTAVDKNALGGKAVRKEVTVHFTSQADGPTLRLLF